MILLDDIYMKVKTNRVKYFLFLLLIGTIAIYFLLAAHVNLNFSPLPLTRLIRYQFTLSLSNPKKDIRNHVSRVMKHHESQFRDDDNSKFINLSSNKTIQSFWTVIHPDGIIVAVKSGFSKTLPQGSIIMGNEVTSGEIFSTFPINGFITILDGLISKVLHPLSLTTGNFRKHRNHLVAAKIDLSPTPCILPLSSPTSQESSESLLTNHSNESTNSSLYHPSPHVLHLTRTSNTWLQQWPIGTGEIGAMIGGLLESEIIPVSIAGLFSHKTRTSKNIPKPISRPELYKEARLAILRGSVGEAQSYISRMEESTGIGTFEYVADLVLLFSSDPITSPSIKGIPPSNKIQPRCAAVENTGSRETMINCFKGSLIEKGTQNMSKSAFRDFMPILQSESVLDMKHGSVHSFIIEGVASTTSPKSTDSGNESHESTNTPIDEAVMHHREWYASSIDNVIVGRMKCGNAELNKTKDIECLNMFFGLNRDIPYRYIAPLTSIQVKEATDNIIVKQLKSNDHEENRGLVSKAISFDLSVRTNQLNDEVVTVPTSHLCGIMICNYISTASANILYASNTNGVVCNNAASIDIVLTAQLVPGAAVDPTFVQSECTKKLTSASLFGLGELLKRHQFKTKQVAEATEVSFQSSSAKLLDLHLPLIDRLASISKYCIRSNGTLESVPLDIHLINQVFQFNRYLLHSGASKAVMNLQGIWADGLKSAWNGDYHMNINMQMSYWAAPSVGLAQTLDPLIDFMQALAVTGSQAAIRVYNHSSDGWVAHGFTDDFLNAGINGSPEWAMCITCGAWLALTAWESSTYELNLQKLENKLLPVLRGSIIFFLEHIFIDEHGIAHSGPTTSPENSFDRMTKDNKREFPILALSPAIDISILRQLSNAFTLSIQWLASKRQETNIDIHNSDVILANKFQKVVLQLPGKGLPISAKSGITAEYPDQSCGNGSWAETSMSFDPGHRHFSPMHWVYPATHPPGRSVDTDEIYAAANRFMEAKKAGNSGHTGWSAAWEGSIWTRLRRPDEAMTATLRLLRKFYAPNLLALHPPLSHSGIRGCGTCFTEGIASKRRISSTAIRAQYNRGFFSSEDDKFQIDGNMGYLAIISEMILSSHIPAVFSLLPALPTELGQEGQTKGLRGRGGVSINMKWKNNEITVANIVFSVNHPWLHPQEETRQGSGVIALKSTQYSNPKQIVEIYILSPNPLVLPNFNRVNEHIAENVNVSCAIDSISNIESVPLFLQSGKYMYRVSIMDFPCTLKLCSANILNSDCLQEFK